MSSRRLCSSLIIIHTSQHLLKYSHSRLFVTWLVVGGHGRCQVLPQSLPRSLLGPACSRGMKIFLLLDPSGLQDTVWSSPRCICSDGQQVSCSTLHFTVLFCFFILYPGNIGHRALLIISLSSPNLSGVFSIFPSSLQTQLPSQRLQKCLDSLPPRPPQSMAFLSVGPFSLTHRTFFRASTVCVLRSCHLP